MSEVILALDFPDLDGAQSLLQDLRGELSWVKVGMQLFYSEGPDVVKHLKNLDYKVFLDIKVHDIPNTAKGAMQSIASLGVDMVNCHISGGTEMLKAALTGLRSQNPDALLIGVSQLTSTSELVMNNEIGIPGSVNDCVYSYAGLAKKCELQGIVCSPLEVQRVKKDFGQDFLTVVPGIRPNWASKDDQHRVTTPKQAQELGADFLVIGRAITNSENPKNAYMKIKEELNERSS